MTNYFSYPSWKKDGLIISFKSGKYSWCALTATTIRYLLESTYCHDASEFYIVDKDLRFESIKDFKEYLRSL